MPCLFATDKCINLITCFSIFILLTSIARLPQLILAGELKYFSSSSDRLCMENRFNCLQPEDFCSVTHCDLWECGWVL